MLSPPLSLTWQINFAAGNKGSEAGRSVWQKSGLVAAPTDSSRKEIIIISTSERCCEDG
jgi:hypothetical protein